MRKVGYTPSSFYTGSCSGSQVIYASGNLTNANSDGTLVTHAVIGPYPACQSNKSLAINH